MTPAEVIALHGCSRPENGHPCSICVGAAERHVRAAECAGMVVVAAEDLRTYLDRGSDLKAEVDAVRRLRAALPERNEDV